MASNYPGSLDSFDTIASDKKTSDAVGGRTHRAMHNDLGDAVEAVQAELGTDPAGTFSTVKARLDQLVAYAAKTSAYTATVADHTLNVTSGTFTLDLPAASTCTGQSLRVKNSGTGVVTLDGNSSETVEGVATFPLGPGSYVEITSTGAAWIITAGLPDTGWRDVSSLLDADAIAKVQTWTTLRLRRVGTTVHLLVFATVGTGTASGTAAVIKVFTTNPAGFGGVEQYECIGFLALTGRYPVAVDFSVSSAYPIINPPSNGNWTSSYFIGELSWETSSSWPTSLPGTAV